MNTMFFVVYSNTLDSNQNITFMIQRLLLYSMNLYHRCSYKMKFQNSYFSYVEVHSIRLEIESTFEKKKRVMSECGVSMNAMLRMVHVFSHFVLFI